MYISGMGNGGASSASTVTLDLTMTEEELVEAGATVQQVQQVPDQETAADLIYHGVGQADRDAEMGDGLVQSVQ